MHPALPVLRLARERLRRGWCQGHHALTATNRKCDSAGRWATQWCLMGATHQRNSTSHGALAALAATLGARHPRLLADWNDAPERTQAEVIAVVEATIQRLESADA